MYSDSTGKVHRDSVFRTSSTSPYALLHLASPNFIFYNKTVMLSVEAI